MSRVLQRRKTEANIEALKRFAQEARKAKLHYVVLKGAAFSQIVYADARRRLSNDIDILVRTEDLPKADWVAKNIGFRQPIESYRARQLGSNALLSESMLASIEAPFLTRTNQKAPHLSPYFRVADSGIVLTLELHDRFHKLDSRKAEGLLWDFQYADIDGIPVATLSDDASLVIALLSLHDDSETIRANIRGDGLGAPTARDLHYWLNRTTGAHMARLSSAMHLAQELGVREACELSLANVVDMFPEDAKLFSDFASRESVWGLRYVERVTTPQLKFTNAERVIKKSLQRIDIETDTLARNRGACARLFTDASFEMAGAKAFFDFDAMRIRWELPLAFKGEVEEYVFGTTFLGGEYSEQSVLGYRVCSFVGREKPDSRIQPITIQRFDEHVTRGTRGISCGTTLSENEGALELECFLPRDLFSRSEAPLRVLFSVHHVETGALYHRIAGDDFAEVVGNLVYTHSVPREP